MTKVMSFFLFCCRLVRYRLYFSLTIYLLPSIILFSAQLVGVICPPVQRSSISSGCGEAWYRAWRSLVSRLVRVQEAVGSNPATRTMRSVLIGSEYPAKALRILFTSIATQNARLCGGLTIMSEHYEQLPHHREFSLTICFFYCIMLQVIWNKLCASVAQR